MDATIRFAEGRAPSRYFPLAPLAAAIVLTLTGCATTGDGARPTAGPSVGKGPGATTAQVAEREAPQPLRVTKVRGTATVRRNNRPVTLKDGDTIAPGEPIQVGKGASMRLNLGEQGLFELGSGARLIAQRLPEATLLGARDTSLRLERGYLRIVWAEPSSLRRWPLDVSVASWGASLQPGEYFFGASTDAATACSTTGEIQLKGNPQTLPDQPARCVSLQARGAARVMTPPDATWESVRKGFTLRPALSAAGTAVASKSATKTSPAAAPASTVAKLPPPPPTQKAIVASVSGAATVRRGTAKASLKRGATVVAGQPIEVGSKSRVELAMPGHGTVALGPSARFTIHKLPEVASSGSQETWLRAEQGSMRIVIPRSATGSTPQTEVSFSRWAAKLGPGEYYVDTQADRATVCTPAGDLRFSGVPETLPATMDAPCVRLVASQTAQFAQPTPEQWTAMRGGSPAEVALALPPPGRMPSAPTTVASNTQRVSTAWVEPPAAMPRSPATVASNPARVTVTPPPTIVARAPQALPEPVLPKASSKGTEVARGEASGTIGPEAAMDRAFGEPAKKTETSVRVAEPAAAPIPAPVPIPSSPVVEIAVPPVAEVPDARPAAPSDAGTRDVADMAAAEAAPVASSRESVAAFSRPDAVDSRASPSMSASQDLDDRSPMEIAAARATARQPAPSTPPPTVPNPPPATVAPPNPLPNPPPAQVLPPNPLPDPPPGKVLPPNPLPDPPPTSGATGDDDDDDDAAMADARGETTVEVAAADVPAQKDGPIAGSAGASSSLTASAPSGKPAASGLSSSSADPMVAMLDPATGGDRPEWLVNVDSFSEESKAKSLLSVLEKDGYHARILTEAASGSPSYRVVIEGISSESSADAIVDQLGSRYTLTSAWVLRTK